MPDAPEFDHAETRALERFLNGEPPAYEGDVIYRHEWDEESGQFVLMPLRPRGTKPVDWRGLSVS